MIFFYFIFLFLLLVKSAYQYDIKIYAPHYTSRIDFSNKQTFPLQIKTQQSTTNVFISLGSAGILIMDATGKNITHQQKLDNNFISCFDISPNGKYLIAGVEQKIVIYENSISNSTNYFNYTQVGQFDFNQQVYFISYNQEKQIIVATGSEGSVTIYDAQDMKNIQSIGNYVSGAPECYNIQISSDGQWIYLSCSWMGTIILKLIEQQTNEGTLQPKKYIIEEAAVGYFYHLSQFSIASNDNQYMYTVDTFYGLYYCKCKDMLSRKKGDKKLVFYCTRFWSFTFQTPQDLMLAISSDDKYLLVATRAHGILVYDNSDKDNLKLLQVIQIDTLNYFVALSFNNQHLYLVNSESIFTFEQTKLNLNDGYPNLFNTQSAKSIISSSLYKPYCHIYNDENYLITYNDYQGIAVIPYNKDPNNLQYSKLKRLSSTVEFGYVSTDNKYLVFPRVVSQDLLGVYQMQPLDGSEDQKQISPINPKLVYNLNVKTAYISEYLAFSQDQKYAIATYEHGIYLLDTSNMLDMKLLQTWENSLNIIGKTSGGCFTRDGNWIFYTVRPQGLFLLNAQNKTNLQLSDYAVTFGGDNIYMSKITDLYAYLCDGIKGMAIVDLTKLPKISFLSRVNLPGKGFFMAIILQNDEYALLTSYDDGVISLVEMKDKKNPQIISTYKFYSVYLSSVCAPPSSKYIFITSSTSIITLPLVSQMNIHTQAYEIFTDKITGKQTVNILNKDENVKMFNEINEEFTFLVGQKIQFNFAFIYPTYKHDETQITGIKWYYDYIQYEIPSYYTHKPFSHTLTMDACNEQLNDQDRRKSNLNTILVNVAIPLDVSQFVYNKEPETIIEYVKKYKLGQGEDKAITNSTQASKIILYLQEKSVLNYQQLLIKSQENLEQFKIETRFVQKLIDPNLQLTLDDLELQTYSLETKLKRTLYRSIAVNPLKFYIKHSLNVDFQNEDSFIQSPYSSTITITLTTDKSTGRFVNFNYQGVISSISHLQDELTISGPLENVNKVLQQRILFAYSSQLNSQLSSINVEIIDYINYRVSQTIPIIGSKFIYIKDHIIANNASALQLQFDKQFPESMVYIESDISFTFLEDTFITTNSSKITCEVYYQVGENVIDDQYKLVTPDLWIQFQFDQVLNFRGTVTVHQYGLVYNFKVVVSDGYTQAEDYFRLKADGIPFLYVFNIVIKVLGPLIAILGFYNKRYVFYNMIFKQKVTFSEEIIYSDQIYKKQIVLVGKTAQDSILITRSLFSKTELLSRHSYKCDDEKIQQLENKFNNYIIKKSSNKTQSEANREKNLSSFGHENNSNSQQLSQSGLQSQGMNYIFKDKNNFKQDSKKFNLQILQQKSHIKKTSLEQRYLKVDGTIFMDTILKDIIELNLLKQLSNSTNYKRMQLYSDDLKNKNSRIYNAIKSLTARYLLNLDKKSFMMYQYIKYYCQNNGDYQNKNDWYKQIITIQYSKQSSLDGSPVLFPELEIKCEQFLKILVQADLIQPEDCEFLQSFEQIVSSQIKDMNINLQLIREVLFADVYGFVNQIPSSFEPSVGESIHLDTTSIKFIVAYKKVNYCKFLDPLIVSLNLDYVRHGISKNMRLPAWVCLDQKHGLITISGIPEREDEEDILIRLYDMTGYVIKQFQLKVKQQENELVKQDFQIPDEKNYVQQPDLTTDTIKRSSHVMKFSRSYSYKQQQESFQLNDKSCQLINQKGVTDSPVLKSKSPSIFNEMKLYEFQKQSNNKNLFTNNHVDTNDDFLPQKIPTNFFQTNDE